MHHRSASIECRADVKPKSIVLRGARLRPLEVFRNQS